MIPLIHLRVPPSHNYINQVSHCYIAPSCLILPYLAPSCPSLYVYCVIDPSQVMTLLSQVLSMDSFDGLLKKEHREGTVNLEQLKQKLESKEKLDILDNLGEKIRRNYQY